MELRRYSSITLLCAAIVGGIAACSSDSDTSGSGGSGEGGSTTDGPGPTSSTGSPASVGSTGTVSEGPGGQGPGGQGPGGAGPGGAGPGGAGQGGAGQGGAGQGGAGQGGGSACAHDVCVVGVSLDPSCSACVGSLCTDDPFCCDPAESWDETCVSEAPMYCGVDCGGTGGAGGGGTGGGGGGGNIQAGDLVITEFMNNPAFVTDANGEWFEVFNATNADIDMVGLNIRHNPDPTVAPHTIASSVVVPAGGYAVLGNNADASTNGGISVAYEYPSTVSLGNSNPDVLKIETADAVPVIIDETSWDPAVLNANGASHNLDPNFLTAFDNDDDTNFCLATTAISNTNTDKGTPGADNDPCN